MKKLLATFYICLLGIISIVAYATPSTATFDFNDGTSTGLTITKSGNSSYAPLNEKFNNINVLDGYFLGASFTSNSSGVVTIITNASYENISSISFNSAATNGSNPKITISIIDDEDVETVVQTAMVLTSGTVNKWRDTPYSKDLSASPKTGKVKFKLTTGSSGVHAAIDNIVITYSPVPAVACTVSFDAGSHGTYTGEDITEESAGGGIELPSLSSLADGYTFNGWYTDASVFAGVAGSNYKPASDITLYAQYLGDATFSPISASSINGNSNVTVTSTGATTIKYAWKESEVAPESGDYSSAAATAGAATISAPNVSGTRYLYVKGVKENGNEGNVAHVSYSITKVKDPAGLTYETSSVSKETGASAFTNTLTNPHSLSVTYSITNNGTGSTINASTGEVTPGSIVGTETITATSEATADYLAGETTYTLTIYSFNGTSIIKVDLTAGSSSASVDVSGTIGGTADVKVQKDTKFGSGHYVGFTLADSKQFKTGDILNVKVTTASENGSIIVYDKKTGADGQTILYNTGVKGVVGENKFVLPSEINNLSTIYICRTTENAWNGFVDYIEVFRPLPSVELNESGYATFYGYANFTVSGATAYKAKLNAGGDALELTSLSGIIPANSAVILVGSADATVTLSYTNETATADMTNNILEGTAVRTTTASLKTKANFYAFDKTDNKFKIYNGANFPANKAFFQTGGSLAPSAIRIEFEENGATDIKSVEEKETAVKFFDGGRILIMKNGVVYDALGRVIR